MRKNTREESREEEKRRKGNWLTFFLGLGRRKLEEEAFRIWVVFFFFFEQGGERKAGLREGAAYEQEMNRN